MLMKDIVNEILNSLGNGKAKTIHRGYDIKSFLIEELKPSIKEKITNCLFF